jgi:hypothetical protein
MFRKQKLKTSSGAENVYLPAGNIYFSQILVCIFSFSGGSYEDTAIWLKTFI